ncbi:hypothetical protein SAMD00019534_058260 [Acytostelium subglobosum LB1]|uniref:hypothetical protein n=1 Tax=Acytostelium subglobosum LB1 TaxID=1410327 RepID=UPI000644F284|nr:hypothetical protein SAMD00019534_058260 [Acytostelium subglobosum LB1]GAM22651.1 hypothetical protein SAMD00019534_058260 [Acytostelium subglobosum LB1]|eukprot:XP_012754771.1 hypothetical protein SAMD00019534_058260 [Acytostelium subglobosum LB1]
MSKLKEIQNQATFAWSPLVDRADLIAAGTVTGTIGADFDTTSKIELYSMDITNASPQMTLKGSVSAPNRFNKIVWLPAHADQTNGLIIGGMESGAISIWNPSKILEGSDDALIGTGQKHNGPVQALDFNIYQPNLIASGGSDSELFIWDLSNPSSPSAYTPGTKVANASDITSISWNRKVQHIIATGCYNGTTVVWDLKAKKSIINFTDRNRKCKTRSLLWNPNEATSIVTASEDDDYPVIQTWDLRNNTAPLKTLEGHRRGIWGMSWCPSDSSLLLSTGKDNRTLCWNIDKGEMLCEIESTGDASTWSFDVQWSPRIPAVFATSSFGGNINAYSMQDVSARNVQASANSLGVVEPQAAPVFKHTPSWLRRPVGAAFGFGGKIAVFGRKKPTAGGSPQVGASTPVAGQRVIRISKVVTDVDLQQRTQRLESVLKTREYEQFCDEKIAASSTPEERATWGFLKVLFDESSRKKILNYLGHDVETTKQELQSFLKTLPELKLTGDKQQPKQEQEQPQQDGDQQQQQEGAETTETSNGEKKDVFNLFKSSTDEFPSDFVKTLNVTPIEFPAEGDEKQITKSLLIGDFSTAVECCLRLGRMADALILASCGSTELWKKTQQAYFEIEQRAFTRVLSCIAREDFATLVQTTDLKDWRSTLSVLCTYGTEENFKSLAGVLGDRLDAANDTEGATLCYICACDIDKTVNIWTRSQHGKESNNRDLLNLIEKVSIFRSATNSITLSNDTLATKYSRYAEILASQGDLSDSLRYLSALSSSHPTTDVSGAVLLDRVYRSATNVQGIAQPQFPFQVVPVYPSGGAPRPQQVPQQNIQNQGQFGQHPPHPQQQQFNKPPAFGNQPPMPFVGHQPQTHNFNPSLPGVNHMPPQPMAHQQQPVHPITHHVPPPPTSHNVAPPSMHSVPPPQHQPHVQPPQTSHVHPPMTHNVPPSVGGMPPMPTAPTTNQFMNPTPPLMSQHPTAPPPMMGGGQFAAPPPSMGHVGHPPMTTNQVVPPSQQMPPSPVHAVPPPHSPPQASTPPPPVSAVAPLSAARPGGEAFPQPPPKPNVHNIQATNLEPAVAADMTAKITQLTDLLNSSLQNLLSRGANKQKWEDASKRVQTLIAKMAKNELSPLAIQALEGVIISISQGEFSTASNKYIQITSTSYWNEIGSQAMVGLKRIIDLGMKPN